MLILTIFFISIALVTVITVTAFRFLVRRSGIKDLIEDGVVLTEDGIEYLRPFLFGRGKIKFKEIESVNMVSYPASLLSLMFPVKYGYSVHRPSHISFRLFGDLVEIKIKKTPRWHEFHFQYLLFTPKNAAAFVEQLKRRLGFSVPPVLKIPN